VSVENYYYYYYVSLVKLGRLGGIFKMPLPLSASSGIKREWYVCIFNKIYDIFYEELDGPAVRSRNLSNVGQSLDG
jgi:hypothetical protein